MVIPSVWAWDFCVPNQDGVMLYYNFIEDDDEACEVTCCKNAEYEIPTIRIPEKVILNRGNVDFGDPDTILHVIGIGDNAFNAARSYTKNIERIELPYGTSYIGRKAFSGCEALEAVVWPKNNEWFYSIGDYAFFRCGALGSFQIPKSTEEIGHMAFAYSGLLSLDFEKGNEFITVIPDSCFLHSGLYQIKIPPFIKEIGVSAFAECPIKSLELPYGLERIDDYAFFDMTFIMERIEIPATVKHLGEYVFCSRGQRKVMKHVRNLYVNASTPPYCISKKTFGDDYYDKEEKKYTNSIIDVTLTVPIDISKEYGISSFEAYRTTFPWNRFPENVIQARDLSGIKPATAKTSQPEDVFSLDGRRLAKTQKGLNIIRYKDGTAKKVVVK